MIATNRAGTAATGRTPARLASGWAEHLLYWRALGAPHASPLAKAGPVAVLGGEAEEQRGAGSVTHEGTTMSARAILSAEQNLHAPRRGFFFDLEFGAPNRDGTPPRIETARPPPASRVADGPCNIRDLSRPSARAPKYDGISLKVLGTGRG